MTLYNFKLIKNNGKMLKHTNTNSEANESVLKAFGIKPCRVNMVRMNFSKIKINCSAQSSGVELSCCLKQTDVNTFCLQVKRKNCNATELCSENPQKRIKIMEMESQEPVDESLIGIHWQYFYYYDYDY